MIQTLPSPAAPCTLCGLISYIQHTSSVLLTFAAENNNRKKLCSKSFTDRKYRNTEEPGIFRSSPVIWQCNISLQHNRNLQSRWSRTRCGPQIEHCPVKGHQVIKSLQGKAANSKRHQQQAIVDEKRLTVQSMELLGSLSSSGCPGAEMVG